MLNPNAHILIYTHKTTPRVKYTFNLILKDCLGLEFTITNSIDDYKLFEGHKLSYTTQDVESDFHIAAHTLLFESGIKEQTIQMQNHEKYFKYFFRTYNNVLPFDVFAASFYLVCRYEEYLPFIPDSFNRFEAENSLAYQYDFLKIPLVNLWIAEFEKLLLKKFPQLIVTHNPYTYVSSIDIDNAYKYKEKGVMRSIGGYLKSLISFDKTDLIDRTSVLFRKEKDPFDSYDYQLAIQKKYKLKVIYFFLLGDYGVNDKNHPSNNHGFQKLIKHLTDYSSPGIHPSFGSNGNSRQVKIEINRLANITHRDIFNSRQHFSMLKFPDTYFTLQELGVTNDYSMGYANFSGFRASYCLPFYWYDLDDELETGLKIHSYCLSETTLRYKDGASPQTICELAKPLIDEVKKYNGELITIFHNDTMGTAQEWIDWQNIYEEIVKLATSK
ncbi:MAG: polysaccharide deacetylase family protein [Bacteroidota bacterium]